MEISHSSILFDRLHEMLNIGFITKTSLINSGCLVWNSVKEFEVTFGL